MYGRGPYRDDVPKPETILGYSLGQMHTTFRDQERVILAIAESAKDRVRVIEYGKSVEGRPLRLVIVSAPENLARLEEIRQTNQKLSDPRTLPANEADKLAASAPAILWINHCIHGDETASFEAFMGTLYNVVSSESAALQNVRKNALVILNPVFNPDGHERFVVWYNSVALGSAEGFAHEKSVPWAIRGRYNHYRFDMNRDKMAQSQPETRLETAAFFQWYPHVFVDQHGQPPVYFFPPNSLPTNANADRVRLKTWTEIFGRANAAAFDTYGWTYVVRETYDLFYPGYLDSFTTLSGAVGMTYETDGGSNLARKRDDGTVSTLYDATVHHIETALTTLETAATHREKLLRDFVAYRRNAIEEGRKSKFRCVIIPAGNDPGRMAEFAAHLSRMNIEVEKMTAPFTSKTAHSYTHPQDKPGTQTFPAGSLVIDMAQPQGRLAQAILEPNTEMEPEFVAEQEARRKRNAQKASNESTESYDFYDITGWALPLTYGFTAYWTEENSREPEKSQKAVEKRQQVAPNTQSEESGLRVPVTAGSQDSGLNTQNPIPNTQHATPNTYLFRPDRDTALILALRLLNEGYRVAAMVKPLTVGKTAWPRGTVVVRVGRNPDSLHQRITTLAGSLQVEVTAITDSFPETSAGLGSDFVVALRKPRIAVATDEGVSQTAYGSVWHQLEMWQIPFTALRVRSLASTDLSNFNLIILPDGSGYVGAIGKSGIARLREWMDNGGTLLGIGGGGTWFADEDAKFTDARRVRAEESKEKGSDEQEAATRSENPLELPGGIFQATIDPTHFLGYGYPSGEIVVPLSGSTFLKKSTTGANVVVFGREKQCLAGFVWPNNTERLLADTAYVIDEPIGDGHALLFLDDPTFRALWPGLRRLFLSSLLYSTTGSKQ